jgi:hypothetical protein
MRTFTLTLLAVLIFTSCEDNADLGDSYYYLDPYYAMDVGYPDGAIIYKSSRKLSFENIIISKEVVEATHNDKFIFAKQLSDTNKIDTSYYIIDKLSDKVFGPLKYDSCEKLKTILKTGQ